MQMVFWRDWRQAPDARPPCAHTPHAAVDGKFLALRSSVSPPRLPGRKRHPDVSRGLSIVVDRSARPGKTSLVAPRRIPAHEICETQPAVIQQCCTVTQTHNTARPHARFLAKCQMRPMVRWAAIGSPRGNKTSRIDANRAMTSKPPKQERVGAPTRPHAPVAHPQYPRCGICKPRAGRLEGRRIAPSTPLCHATLCYAMPCQSLVFFWPDIAISVYLAAPQNKISGRRGGL